MKRIDTSAERAPFRTAERSGAARVLVVDVGGTQVKLLATGETVRRELTSGPELTPHDMVVHVTRMTADWQYDAVSLGYPGPVRGGQLAAEPHNLGRAWLNFDFQRAFERPVKIINDAAMQALGNYNGGRMLFLGLGTGLGSALIVDGVLVPLEVAHLPYRKGRTYEDVVGLRGLARIGQKRWRQAVAEVVALFQAALEADDVVLGGGNVKLLQGLPAGARVGDADAAFTGGFRLWTNDGRARIAGGMPPQR